MSLTGNYEAAFEIREEVVRDIFLEAWKSGEIPHELQTSQTIMGYNLHAIVRILEVGTESQLSLSFDTPIPAGIKMTVPLNIQVVVENSPAPGINPINFSAGLEITAPLQAVPDASGNKELVLNLAGLPDSQVKVSMPAAPVLPVTAELIEDGIHKAYDDGMIPHSVVYMGITVDVDDDDADPNRQIKFALDTPDRGTVTLPIYIHFGPGLQENIKIHNIWLTRAGDTLTISFSHVTGADVETSPLLSLYKETLATMVRAYPDYPVYVPGNDTIAGFIREAAKQQLSIWGADHNGRLHIYTPNAVENSPITIVDFVPVVKPGFLAVLFNPMEGADPNAVENFIPADKKFAQALAEPVVQKMIDQALKEKILDENGCGGWPCKFNHEIEGHEVTLTNKPSFGLHDGYIQMNGSAEVAVDCWFDPDVDYEAKVKFHFEIDGAGNKVIVPDIYDEDIDLSCLDWFLGFIIIIYGWIALIVVNVVIESVGGEIAHAEGEKIAKGTKYIAGEIHGVGGVTTELDRIDIKPGGIILSGGTFIVTSSYALTAVVPADSAAPYFGLAASLLSLDATHLHASAKYHWKLGDTTTAEGSHVEHRYSEDGTYLAELTTEVDQSGGWTTHHYARVRVDNVQPVAHAGPDIVANEGQVINFLGHFTDAEWVDKHEATWRWGDNSIGEGTVVETNSKPQAEGTVTGSHAYCDNGDYTVELRVRDDDGGVGRDALTVKVQNVAPTVEGGEDMFAYPCTPITLVAHFTDPGWCDTHIGFWEFGDCTPLHPAIIREHHEPPAGTGIAAAAHIYHRCGTYRAECTVIDDDGGIGRDTITVRVVDVRNRRFEDGFRSRLVGAVANEWEPYPAGTAGPFTAAALEQPAGGGGLFSAEEFIVHSGQRSQRIGGTGAFRAGIYQRVGANPDWDYQISAWYHLDERMSGCCRLGIDPTGGTNPASITIEWTEGKEHRNWAQLAGRVTAKDHGITIFLEAVSDTGGAIAYFDDVVLIPSPCPLKEELPPPPPKEEEVCVDWREEQKPRPVGVEHQKKGFIFRSASQQPLQIAVWGIPSNQGKLQIPGRGLQVEMPFPATRVIAYVVLYTNQPIRMEAFDSAHRKLGEATTPATQAVIQTLEVKGTEITSLLFTGSKEGLLIRLCAYRQGKRENAKPVEAGTKA